VTYDNWKTREDGSPHDFEAPCEEKPKHDDDDVCLYCGANPTQACQWHRA
jgi:hypothetical protein